MTMEITKEKLAAELRAHGEFGTSNSANVANSEKCAEVIIQWYEKMLAPFTAPVSAEQQCCGKPVHDGDPEGYQLACCGKFLLKSAEPQPVASIVPDHCTGSALAFVNGVLHVSKDGSGYIAVNEDDFHLEDDRCEGPDGPEGSVHWITPLSGQRNDRAA